MSATDIFGGSSRVKRIERTVTDIDSCDFYHVIELPNGKIMDGQWDLRDTVAQYLGETDFRGKRVLEIGPASGFLSYHMERCGAEVTCIEPPLDEVWDFVPQAAVNLSEERLKFTRGIERLRNSFWYLHQLYRSKVECYEADAYRLPQPTQKFDIGILAAVLLHVASPLKMLESVARVVSEKIIVVDAYIEEIAAQPVARLIPDASNRTIESWWQFSPKIFEQYLAVLGFSSTVRTRHRARAGRWVNFADLDLFTVVATP